MKVLVATPCHGREVTIDYFYSIMGLEAWFRTKGIASEVMITVGSVLPRNRSVLASKVLADPSFDYLLFIDSDMRFRPELVEKMLASGKPFTGCLYPSRSTDYGRLHSLARQIESPVTATSAAQGYVGLGDLVFAPDEAGKRRLVTQNGLFLMRKTGFGVTLLHRQVLEKLREAFPDLMLPAGHPEYVKLGAKYPILQAFESLKGDDGMYFGEDYSFSTRWTRGCNGEIWGCADEEIGHVGPTSFSGRASDRLRADGHLS